MSMLVGVYLSAITTNALFSCQEQHTLSDASQFYTEFI